MATSPVTEEDILHRRAFGDAVRSVRLSRDMSQEELALRAGIDRSYMGRIERGEQALSIDKIWQVSDALNTDPARLFSISIEAAQLIREREGEDGKTGGTPGNGKGPSRADS